MHSVSVLALDGVLAFDLSTPLEVFGRARLPDGRVAYTVRVCAPHDEVDAGAFGLRSTNGLDALAGADTIILPGLADPTAPVSDDVLEALRAAAEGGTRIASICVGAFTLAAAGLLDGLRATTHWAAAKELSRRYPEVEVDAGVLYVDNGGILTSAGAAAGLDLCLYMIRQDHGSAVAADAARLAVMPLQRDGGQAQYIVHEQPGADGSNLPPALALDRRERQPEPHPRRPCYQGEGEYPHPEPAFPRADSHDPDAVAAQIPDPQVSILARDYGIFYRADRSPGRVRLSDELPRTLQEVGRHQPAGLPARVPGFTSLLTETVERWNP
jgi:putative intracellular protease/amidase